MKSKIIFKYMDLSTGHISHQTAEWLDENPEGIIMYPKGEYGWFIHVSEETDEQVPADLAKVLKFAQKKNCAWLVLDRDGESIDELEKFDW